MTGQNACADEIAADGHVYSLLARMWLQEAGPSLIDTLGETELGRAWRNTGGVIPSRDEIEDLAAEYCRLFIGPKNHVAPYQSVWEGGRLETEIASSVNRFADLLNYQVPPEYPRTMSDHLGVQLDIMGVAMTRWAEDISQHPDELAGEVLREFFTRHLTWPDRLLKASANQASSTFYRSMIEITASFLQSQRATWLHPSKDGQASP